MPDTIATAVATSVSISFAWVIQALLAATTLAPAAASATLVVADIVRWALIIMSSETL
jgi:hypothetical protein